MIDRLRREPAEELDWGLVLAALHYLSEHRTTPDRQHATRALTDLADAEYDQVDEVMLIHAKHAYLWYTEMAAHYERCDADDGAERRTDKTDPQPWLERCVVLSYLVVLPVALLVTAATVFVLAWALP